MLCVCVFAGKHAIAQKTGYTLLSWRVCVCASSQNRKKNNIKAGLSSPALQLYCIKFTVTGQSVDEMTQITEETVRGDERRSADVSERTLTSRCLTPMIVYCADGACGRRASGVQSCGLSEKKKASRTVTQIKMTRHSRTKKYLF